MAENEKKDHFSYALTVIALVISISIVSFMSEEIKITGFAVSSSDNSASQPDSNLKEYKNFNDLSSLAAGNYFIDHDGVVYWMDDESRPAIGKIDFIRDIQKNRQVYIDANGNIGYTIK